MRLDIPKYLARRYAPDGCYALVVDVYADNGLSAPPLGGGIARCVAEAKRKWTRRAGEPLDGDVLLCEVNGAATHAAIKFGKWALHVRNTGCVVLTPIKHLRVDSTWHLGEKASEQ